MKQMVVVVYNSLVSICFSLTALGLFATILFRVFAAMFASEVVTVLTDFGTRVALIFTRNWEALHIKLCPRTVYITKNLAPGRCSRAVINYLALEHF